MVTGTVVATRKDDRFKGLKLLVLQPLNPDGRPQGRTFIGADAVGAGVGEEVFFVRGREASFPFLPKVVPTDVSVVGIVDHWSVENVEINTVQKPIRGKKA
jgi:microcompartment protein CcmK/EutM